MGALILERLSIDVLDMCPLCWKNEWIHSVILDGVVIHLVLEHTYAPTIESGSLLRLVHDLRTSNFGVGDQPFKCLMLLIFESHECQGCDLQVRP